MAVLTGDNTDNLLIGGPDDDTIEGFGGNDTIEGGAGSDDLRGGTGADLINPGDNTDFDYIVAGTGADTIDFGDVVGGFVILDHWDLSNSISVSIDGAANTGTIDAGPEGTDTLIDVANPLDAGGTTGGLEIRGTAGNDSFDLAPDSEQWMRVRGGAGADSFIINGAGLVQLDFRDATQGIDIDLASRQINDDGFGNTESIGGTSAVWDIRGSSFDDTFLGSDADNTYSYTGGNNSVDGGGGFDRLRYDQGSVASVEIDAAAGTAQGTLNAGGGFTDVIAGFERLRGSDGDDTITGDGTDNLLEGEDGNDILQGRVGNDTLQGGAGNDTLESGSGNDTLEGGLDADRFVIKPGDEQVTILDFELGLDTLDLLSFGRADALSAFHNAQAGSAVLTFDDGTVVTVGGDGVSPETLSLDDVEFAPGESLS